jgi:hypothetical protein
MPPKTSHYLDKPLEELVKDLTGGQHPDSALQHEINAAINVKVIREFSASIQAYKVSSDVLANRLFWLNIILGTFTVIGTIIAVAQLFGKP